MKIQVVVLPVVTPLSVTVGYQRFGWPCCFHLQGEMTLVSYHIIIGKTTTQTILKSLWIKFELRTFRIKNTEPFRSCMFLGLFNDAFQPN